MKANWGRFYFNTGTASGTINPAAEPDDPVRLERPERRSPVHAQRDGKPRRQSPERDHDTIDPNIKHSYTDSTSLWLEHELFRDVGMRFGYTFKWDGNSSATVEQNRVYSLYTSQVRVDDPGADGTAGNADDGPPFIVYEIPTTPAISSRAIVQTVDGVIATDRAVDLTLTRRMRNNWSLMTNFLYNWDRDRGYVQNPNQERFNDNTVTGWAFKIVGTYRAPWGIVVSPVLRHQSGDTLARVVQASRGVDLATGVDQEHQLHRELRGRAIRRLS